MKWRYRFRQIDEPQAHRATNNIEAAAHSSVRTTAIEQALALRCGEAETHMHAHTDEGAALVVSQFHVRHVFIGAFESTALIVEEARFDYRECRYRAMGT